MSSKEQSHSAGDERVFAAYGRAMHGSQALEFWLRVLVNVHQVTLKDFASQAELDRAVDTLSTSTMGTVFSALRTLARDPILEEKLTMAVGERNRLAHHFFSEWSDAWDGLETEIEMIEDANRVQMLFEETVRDLAATLGKHLDVIGSNPDAYMPGLQQRLGEFNEQGEPTTN
ncbi:hypothetical protein E3T25_08825 [Cryobacterium sandaracinum]|uniref:MarR family transcriptional regulator n=1 Tax=Cryobacterium sandaracinum TaxID=1259247 RepID=A0ABY2JBT6_9MICO|nr:hypothetical protein [Cryobacterium sandaracinum]TFD02416.1 hypothetical protein E3T25_08825 [Cryobacterium sandaracinum]